MSLVLGMALVAVPVAEVHAARDCPHHDSHGFPGSEGRYGSTHAVHTGGAASAADLHDGGSAPDEERCDCPSDCNGRPPATGLAPVPELAVDLAAEARLAGTIPESWIPQPAPYLLPFPNGPPALSA